MNIGLSLGSISAFLVVFLLPFAGVGVFSLCMGIKALLAGDFSQLRNWKVSLSARYRVSPARWLRPLWVVLAADHLSTDSSGSGASSSNASSLGFGVQVENLLGF